MKLSFDLAINCNAYNATHFTFAFDANFLLPLLRPQFVCPPPPRAHRAPWAFRVPLSAIPNLLKVVAALEGEFTLRLQTNYYRYVKTRGQGPLRPAATRAMRNRHVMLYDYDFHYLGLYVHIAYKSHFGCF